MMCKHRLCLLTQEAQCTYDELVYNEERVRQEEELKEKCLDHSVCPTCFKKLTKTDPKWTKSFFGGVIWIYECSHCGFYKKKRRVHYPCL